jgi:hypothetical protein
MRYTFSPVMTVMVLRPRQLKESTSTGPACTLDHTVPSNGKP